MRSGRPFREDGNEGEDADAAVAGEADGSREPGLAGRAGGAERLDERGVGAEVEHVERGGGRLLTHERDR